MGKRPASWIYWIPEATLTYDIDNLWRQMFIRDLMTHRLGKLPFLCLYPILWLVMDKSVQKKDQGSFLPLKTFIAGGIYIWYVCYTLITMLNYIHNALSIYIDIQGLTYLSYLRYIPVKSLILGGDSGFCTTASLPPPPPPPLVSSPPEGRWNLRIYDLVSGFLWIYLLFH